MVGRVFLLPLDIKPCSVLSAVVSCRVVPRHGHLQNLWPIRSCFRSGYRRYALGHEFL